MVINVINRHKSENADRVYSESKGKAKILTFLNHHIKLDAKNNIVYDRENDESKHTHLRVDG